MSGSAEAAVGTIASAKAGAASAGPATQGSPDRAVCAHEAVVMLMALGTARAARPRG